MRFHLVVLANAAIISLRDECIKKYILMVYGKAYQTAFDVIGHRLFVYGAPVVEHGTNGSGAVYKTHVMFVALD